MRINLSLSLKLTLMVFTVSAVVILSLTYINIQEQSNFFENAYSEKATALAQSLDASIGSRSDLEDKQRLQNYILNFILLNKEEVLKVSINLPEENGLLRTAVSSDSDHIGAASSYDNYISFQEDITVSIPSHSGDTHMLTVITPLHLSGEGVGTYEMLLSMDAAYATLDKRARNLVMISVIFLFFLVITFLYLLRRAVVLPIATFRSAAKKIGRGELDIKIKIKSRDELGDLATAFNHMTNDLKKSRAEIENYSKTLEIKVDERTKELEGSKEELRSKVEALENNKRALLNIMGDLKKTIGDLENAKKEIDKKNIDLNAAQKKLSELNRELEQKVKERTAEVEQVLKQKDEFIGQLGHDLKNPLVPITNLLPVIKKKVDDPEVEEFLEIIQHKTNYIKNLVVNILELARLNSPSVTLDKEDLDLLDVANLVIDHNQLIFEDNDVNIENMIDEKININADKLKLEELFSNLYSNAAKYMERGGNIVIDAKETKDDVIVSIKDNGIGLTKEELKHIFDEFYKADWSRHDKESSGLGLAICKRIIEKHGGKIWAESSGLKKGTTFYFTIPKHPKKGNNKTSLKK